MKLKIVMFTTEDKFAWEEKQSQSFHFSYKEKSFKTKLTRRIYSYSVSCAF